MIKTTKLVSKRAQVPAQSEFTHSGSLVAASHSNTRTGNRSESGFGHCKGVVLLDSWEPGGRVDADPTAILFTRRCMHRNSVYILTDCLYAQAIVCCGLLVMCVCVYVTSFLS